MNKDVIPNCSSHTGKGRYPDFFFAIHYPQFTINYFILALSPINCNIYAESLNNPLNKAELWAMPQKGKHIEDISGGEIVLYQNNLEVKLLQDTVWLTQKQMSALFDKDSVTKSGCT